MVPRPHGFSPWPKGRKSGLWVSAPHNKPAYSDLDGDADNTDDSRSWLLDLMLKMRGQPAGLDDPHARVPVCITLAIRSHSALGWRLGINCSAFWIECRTNIESNWPLRKNNTRILICTYHRLLIRAVFPFFHGWQHWKVVQVLSPLRKKSVHAQLYLGWAKPVSVRHLSCPS